jgi:hypothetical protein
MWYHSIPYFPLGQSGIRKLLILRGTAGFIGLFGLYCKSSSSQSQEEEEEEEEEGLGD